MLNTDSKRLLDSYELFWIAVSVVFVVTPHILRVPIWISITFFTLMIWRLTGSIFSWSLPKKNHWWFRIAVSLLAFACLFGIFISYHNIVGRDPGVALLVVLASFKLLEARTERDAYILICVGYILIITNFFFDESIFIAIFMLIATTILTSCFIVLNDRNRNLSTKKTLQLSSSLLLFSIPVMIVLFVFFPRVAGPLWKMPQDTHSAKTGISDKMSPGSISRLSQSNALAFRIEFLDGIPSNENLYWRGPVLWHTDGRTWSRDQAIAKSKMVNDLKSEKITNYYITLEATNKPWLYALDTVVKSNSGIITQDAQLITSKPILKRKRYRASSSTQLSIVETNEEMLNKALQLPEKSHPKTKALANSWIETGLSKKQIINRALSIFSEQAFYYTLQPPLLNQDPVDEFLFDTKQGFCEHYASAFVVLMRAAGIPARIVTGYQGATKNPMGNHYNVYQRDAHAWAEVYFSEQGWIRIDPTSAVAPERVMQGIEETFPDALNDGLFTFDENSLTNNLLRRFRYSWDMVNYRWNTWVLSYNDERQLQLLNQLGIKEFNLNALITLIGGLFLGLIITLMFIALFLFRSSLSHADAASKYYYLFCQKISKLGFTKLNNEGPHDFSERIKKQLPELSNVLDEITLLYTNIRYNSDETNLSLLKQKVKQFNPNSIVKLA